MDCASNCRPKHEICCSIDNEMMSTNFLFERLKESSGKDWQRYTEHEFVRQLGAGTSGGVRKDARAGGSDELTWSAS